MRICDFCGEKMEQGYLCNDVEYYCDYCIHEIYTEDELDKAYESDEVYWTTFYDD